MKTQIAIAQNLIFRRTASHKGRHLAVTPNNSAMRHLSYGRIIVDAGMASVRFATGERETGLICLSGHGSVAVVANFHVIVCVVFIYCFRLPWVAGVIIHTPDVARSFVWVGRGHLL